MKPRYIIKMGDEIIHKNSNGMSKEMLKRTRDDKARAMGHDIYDRIKEDPGSEDLARELRNLIKSGTLPYISRSQ